MTIQVVITLLAAALSGPADRRADAEAVAAAEREFSARAGVVGYRDAFIEYFAPDAIAFGPGPRLALGPLRRAPRPRAVLEWRPACVEVSGGGDMALSTGPVIVKLPDGKPPVHSFYTSVWERQANGDWKVVIDMGTETPAPDKPLPDWAATGDLGPRAGALEPRALAEARASLIDAELALAQASHDATDVARAYAGHLAPAARLHRSGSQPVVGEAAVAAQLAQAGPAKADWQPQGLRIAASGDFGVTWGTGTWTARGEGAKAAPFAFMHVWRRSAGGWRLLTDVAEEMPTAP